MMMIIIIIINIITIKFFKIDLQDYWPTTYVVSYIFVKVHHSDKFCPFPRPILELVRR